MKTIFLRVFILILASAVISGCSKEKLPASKSGEVNIGAKFFPVYNYGGIAGKLTPAPYYSVLKIYNDAEYFSTAFWPDIEGQFKIGGLVPGTYRMMVVYIPNLPGNPPVGEYRYYEIQRILVEPGTCTELGDIVLIPK